ncbi:MAG: glycosyltransferase [Candidatus Hodarchaeota archaeon]
MDLFNWMINALLNILDFISKIEIFFLLTLLIILFNILLHFTKDKIYLNSILINKDPEISSINDLKFTPLVNIIIPAWNEGLEFKECLLSIEKLNYPKLKVIISAGGNEETIKIAESYKNRENYIVLHQIGGKKRYASGKIAALNQCIEYITEGISYLIDADCYITDEILLRMIYPIVNLNENVTINTFRPLKSQEGRSFVNYLQFDRVGNFKGKFKRYNKIMVSGSNTCVSYKAIKAIGKFNEKRMLPEDHSRGYDLISKGFKIYMLVDYRSRMYSAYPNNLKEYFEQRKRYFANAILSLKFYKKRIYYFRFLFVFLMSVFILMSPIFLFIHISFIIISFFMVLEFYFIKIRKYLFFRKIVEESVYQNFHKILFLKLFFYVCVEILINVLVLIRIPSYLKEIKE